MPERRSDLDKLLAGLAGKVPPPLAGWHFTAVMRQRVQERVASLPMTGGTTVSSRQRRLKWSLVGTVVLGLVLLFLIWWHRPTPVPEPPAGFKVTPMQYHYMVSLNGPEPDALVSIGQVEAFNQFLVSISKRRPAGWQLIYTQPLDAYLVLPVQVIRSDTSRNALILITYQAQWGPEYRYLILEFDGDKVIPYREQDKITGTGR
ncbi:hypothetical protein MHLNE_14850 [Moorella humiferrea]|uniref:Uncharacterized protein n=1 Tax=Neomoorella humiferrea TaxID=676965 RepID=A0A2T0AW50_9FIRM|nr:hypothetical protein [Moorella humiferrea]PRR74767.1 hypothetical protein MOHU_07480 [Moorella humiferrea]